MFCKRTLVVLWIGFECCCLTHFLFHYLPYDFKSRDEISFRGKDCNTPGVINTKTAMSSYALQSIWSYWKLWYAFTKTSLHLCYECCLVWFGSSSKICCDMDFRKPWFPMICFTPKNLIQNRSTFWGWALKQKCRACRVVQSWFLEFSKLFRKIWNNLKRRNSLNVPFFNSNVHFKM